MISHGKQEEKISQHEYNHLKEQLKNDLKKLLREKAGIDNLLNKKVKATNKELIIHQRQMIESKIHEIQEEINELNICVWTPAPAPMTSPQNSGLGALGGNSSENSPAIRPGQRGGQGSKATPAEQDTEDATLEELTIEERKETNNSGHNPHTEQIRALEKQIMIEKKVERGAKNMLAMIDKQKDTPSSRKLYIEAETMLGEAQTKIELINIKLLKAKKMQAISSSGNKENLGSNSPIALNSQRNYSTGAGSDASNSDNKSDLSNPHRMGSISSDPKSTTTGSPSHRAIHSQILKQCNDHIDILRHNLRIEWDMLVSTEKMMNLHKSSTIDKKKDREREKSKEENLFKLSEKYSIATSRLILLYLAIKKYVDMKVPIDAPISINNFQDGGGLGDLPNLSKSNHQESIELFHPARKQEISRELEILNNKQSFGQLTSKLFASSSGSPGQNHCLHINHNVSALSGFLDINIKGVKGILETLPISNSNNKLDIASFKTPDNTLLPDFNNVPTKSSKSNSIISSTMFSKFGSNKGSDPISPRKSVKLAKLSSSKPSSSLLLGKSQSVDVDKDAISKMTNEISCVLKLDNEVVAQTTWAAPLMSCWNEKFNLELERNKELSIEIWWRDIRAMSAVKYIRLEDIIDNDFSQGACLELEPQGKIMLDMVFQNPRIERTRRKLQRQKRIFLRKDIDKAMDMNIEKENIAVWSRIMRRLGGWVAQVETQNVPLKLRIVTYCITPVPRTRRPKIIRQETNIHNTTESNPFSYHSKQFRSHHHATSRY